jgi:DNA helicase-2/ATP-dependent DNA helicase PcrA
VTSGALKRARARILGDERVVVIEAAAGCGKTFEAVDGTTALAQQLGEGQEVLLLTHTNSARQVFEGRLAPAGVRATMQTLDSLAFEVVKRYAPHLGLEQPVVPDAVHHGHPSFKDVRAMARHLLEGAPAVAEGLAWRHPVILVDEHQDSSDDQHAVVAAIAEKRDTRVRYFGDRLQSIYGFDGGGGAWDTLCDEHEEETLEFGQRWRDNAELGDWLRGARRALLTGEPINLRDRPRCVHVHQWSGEPHGVNRKGFCPEVLTVLQGVRLHGRSALLVSENAHARGLVERLGAGPAKLYEGADVKEPRRCLELVLDADGDPARLARLLGEVLGALGPGVPKSRIDELATVCTSAGIRAGKRKNILPLVNVCRALYASPTVSSWLAAFRTALERRDELGWRPLRRDAAWLLAAMPGDTDDHLAALLATARAHAQRSRGPSQAVMTVHRAKGSEFDTVVIPYVSASNFGSEYEDAKRLYVAITRPQRELHLLLSRDDPSPRFRL